MAITKVTRNLLSTGIDDQSNATAITIDSSEKLTIANDLESTWAASADRFIGMKFSTTYALGMNLLESGREVRINAKAADTGGKITFGTGTSYNERMIIDGSGNVGIGNSSPLGNLTISNAAGANAPTTVTAANTYLQLGSDDYGPSSNGKFMIGFGYTDATNTNSPAYIGFEETSNSGDTKGELTFYTRDVITDTAPTERMRITDGGDVGIGNSSPTRNLTVGDTGSSSVINIKSSATNGYSTLALGDSGDDNYAQILLDNSTNKLQIQNGGGGALGNRGITLDSSENVGIGTSSPTQKLTVANGFGIFEGIKVGQNGTDIDSTFSGSSSILAFKHNGTEAMRIDSSGNLLVGTTSQTFGEKLKVTTSGSGNNTAFFEFTSSDDRAVIISKHGWSTGSTSRTHLAILNDSNTQVGSIDATGTATTFNTSSDGRLKDVTGEARGLEVINELNPVAYNWKESGQADEGLIAQEVLDIVPNAVTGSEEKYYQMDYSKLVTPLIKAIQEQQTIIDDLKTRIETLENA